MAEGVRRAPDFGSSVRAARLSGAAQLFGFALKVVTAVPNVSEQLKVGHALSVLGCYLK